MSGVKVRYRVDFGGKPESPVEEKVEVPSGSKPPSRAARQLALAHYIERLVEEGTIKGYAEAARVLGVTRARTSQVMNLLNLSPKHQEDVLLGRVEVSERRLREVLCEVEWRKQRID